MTESREDLVLRNEAQNGGDDQGPERDHVVAKLSPDQEDEDRGDEGEQRHLVEGHGDTLTGVHEGDPD